jgi:phosphomethylpyrimidine synthase
MTQLIAATRGDITPEMQQISRDESIEAAALRDLIAAGKLVIPHNKKRRGCTIIGIGAGLRTKINANIGTSQDHCNLNEEMEKLRVAVEAGADTVMDLSTGGNIDQIRKILIEHSPVPVGTVPIYQAAVELLSEGKTIADLDERRILETIRKHAEDGVDFITIHCGVTLNAVRKIDGKSRIMDVVSRGGSLLVRWMREHGKENPFFTAYDKIIEIAREFDVTFSLGDGLRPGCIRDATDGIQLDELLVLGELRDRAVEAGVQVMIEGPGHIPLGEVRTNVQIEKKVCKGAPFYVLGPLVTDVAPGYDHIVSAIGGAIAAAEGADFLCFVTPSEHLRLPTVEDVREGVIASKIAAHIGDLEKGIAGAEEWDAEMSRARQRRDWERMFALALDPQRPRAYRRESQPASADVCTMCGDLCSMKTATRGAATDEPTL